MPQFQSILVVCVGNICRSPMGEAFLAQALSPLGTKVHSAGIGALVGEPADPFSQQVMIEKGIDISTHRARQVSEEMVRNSELILAMERFQVEDILKKFPFAQGRVYRLGHWDKEEIPDPYQRPIEHFRQAQQQIEAFCQSWLKKIS